MIKIIISCIQFIWEIFKMMLNPTVFAIAIVSAIAILTMKKISK